MASASEALRMLKKYPDRRPLICIKAVGLDSGLEEGALAEVPDRKKFLVPETMSCKEFKDVIRKHIRESVNVSISADSINIMASGKVLSSDDGTIGKVYEKHKAVDSFFVHILQYRKPGRRNDVSEIINKDVGRSAGSRPPCDEAHYEASEQRARHLQEGSGILRTGSL
jgi:GABA(A) receptor-associated protein